MRFETNKIVALLGAIFLLVSGAVMASEDDHINAKRLREAGKIVSLETILKDSRVSQGGRIIEIELEKKQDKYVYEVEFVDTEGQSHEYYYDAGNGKFIWEKKENNED